MATICSLSRTLMAEAAQMCRRCRRKHTWPGCIRASKRRCERSSRACKRLRLRRGQRGAKLSLMHSARRRRMQTMERTLEQEWRPRRLAAPVGSPPSRTSCQTSARPGRCPFRYRGRSQLDEAPQRREPRPSSRTRTRSMSETRTNEMRNSQAPNLQSMTSESSTARDS